MGALKPRYFANFFNVQKQVPFLLQYAANTAYECYDCWKHTAATMTVSLKYVLCIKA